MTWWRPAFEAACEHLDRVAIRMPDGGGAPEWQTADELEELFPEHELAYRAPDGSLWSYGLADLTRRLHRLPNVPALSIRPTGYTEDYSLLYTPFLRFTVGLAGDMRYLTIAARLDRADFDRATMLRSMGGLDAVRAYLDAWAANAPA